MEGSTSQDILDDFDPLTLSKEMENLNIEQDLKIKINPSVDPQAQTIRKSISSPTKLLINLSSSESFSRVPFRDPTSELLTLRNPSLLANRKLLGVNDVPLSEEGFVILAKSNCWRAYAKLAQALITSSSKSETQVILKLWAHRFFGLFKLKQYRIVQEEIDRLGYFDNTYREIMENNLFNFEICLIHAQLPYYLNRPFEAMDRHVELTSVLKGGNEGHLKYVYVSLSQILVLLKEPSLAIAALKRVEVVVESDDYYYLHSLVGRIYLNELKTGDVKNAQQHFQLCTGGSSLTCTSLDLANKALLQMCMGKFDEAAELWGNLSTKTGIHEQCYNNIALCNLYLGISDKVLPLLESSVKNVNFPLAENILNNTFILYELISPSPFDCKVSLLPILAKTAGDNIEIKI